jgi:hypothetical protein
MAAYSKKTRVGNYFEDLQLEETRIKEYLAKKERGDLHVVRLNTALGTHLAPAVLSRRDPATGHVPLGASVMLFSHGSRGSVAHGDTDPTDRGGVMLAPAQVTLDNNPYARSVFTLRAPPERAPVAVSNRRPGLAGGGGRGACGSTMSLRSEDIAYDCLRFGQRVQLEIRLKGRPWYLWSTGKSMLHSSRVTDRQLVALAEKPEWRTVWQVLPVRAADRVALDGEPVPADDAVILNHCATNMHLLSDGKVFRTLMGHEVELACGKALNEHRAEKEVHFFSFVLADDDEEDLVEEAAARR